MTAKIFISWSGERSQLIAEALADWLPKVIQSADTWMSDMSIAKGERWSDEIVEALSNHHIGIFCVTPENFTAPWLVFEAGALSTACNKINVCPLLFGMGADDLDGPLTQFQATIFEKEDFFKLLRVINDVLGEDKLKDSVLREVYNAFWISLFEKVKSILKTKLEGHHDEIRRIVKAISSAGLVEPVIGDYANFESGYESHQLYSIAATVARDRLYVYGRKNRKFFDKEYYDFFRMLPEKLKQGFDFRVLFLNPKAPTEVLNSAHKDPDFEEQLVQNLEKAVHVLSSFGIDPLSICRVYETQRPHGLMIVDDAVLHSPFEYDISGTLRPTTKSAFSVIGSTTSFGIQVVQDFIKTWDEAKTLDI